MFPWQILHVFSMRKSQIVFCCFNLTCPLPQQVPRVPIQALAMVVPPQEPDRAPSNIATPPPISSKGKQCYKSCHPVSVLRKWSCKPHKAIWLLQLYDILFSAHPNPQTLRSLLLKSRRVQTETGSPSARCPHVSWPGA